MSESQVPKGGYHSADVAYAAMDYLGYPKRGRIFFLEYTTTHLPIYIASTNHKVRAEYKDQMRRRMGTVIRAPFPNLSAEDVMNAE